MNSVRAYAIGEFRIRRTVPPGEVMQREQSFEARATAAGESCCHREARIRDVEGRNPQTGVPGPL